MSVRFLAYWALALWLLASCWSAGFALVRRLGGRRLPLEEQAVVGLGAGAFAFYLLAWLAGVGGLLGRGFFVAGPLLLLASGVAAERARLGALARRLGRLRWRLGPWPLVAIGAACVAGVYAAAIVPGGVGFDALWYHLPIAEAYAAQGAIRRFDEGWLLGAYPHLSSVIFSWCFSMPWGTVSDRALLSLHVEVGFFLAMLAAIPALTRAALGGPRVAWSWLVVPLFPAIFFHRPAAGGDYIHAFWSAPIFLVFLRYWRGPRPGLAALLGALIAAALSTKYIGVIVVVGPLLALSARAAWASVRGLRGAAVERRGLALAAAVALAGTAPHWLKNLLWYGDPVYPLLYRSLPLDPWGPEATHLQQFFWATTELWRPRPTLEGLSDSLKALFTFSFVPNEWGSLSLNRPTFGSLFTLSLLPALLLRAWRPLAIHACCLAGVFCWYWIHHQDRYLLGLLAPMAASTAAVLWLLWKTHTISRIIVALLVAAQGLWGLTIFAEVAPWQGLSWLLAAPGAEAEATRLLHFEPWHSARGVLPRGAKVLVHESQVKLGLGRPSVSDAEPWQGGLHYLSLGSDRAIAGALRKMGVTHVLWRDGSSRGFSSLGSDLAFFSFARQAAPGCEMVFDHCVAPVPDEVRDLGGAERLALVAACSGRYQPGVYPIGALSLFDIGADPRPAPAPTRPVEVQTEAMEQALEGVSFVAYDSACAGPAPPSLEASFELAATRGGVQLWVRAE